ncbi:NADH:flavin oxidoreductase/NADH oxidase family protein [Alloalcanivorax mobilis]|uniref:NADH:flavin oxidoreductase/NADH oxidase family protein n=1 Tax=Alloalcanivorax mobilis TaxID=2019569 RepID=UPI000C78F95C|nr:NADH:flavin oxidoreductase/NADH oxidase family protein [Alloalcanivorax mobilis]
MERLTFYSELTMADTTLDQPLTLPCGTTLKNRLGKSAMSETLGTPDNRVTGRLANLYRAWAQGGAGLSITGNVMIDSRALGEPCNVVVEDRRDMARLKAWARAGSENGTALWMQINHPGKQAPAALNRATVAPSAVPFSDPNLKRFFHLPRALSQAEITDLVRRFGETAAVAREAGFGGVQIHGAHGYLISQFLSPRHNVREDQYGGNPQNRMRFVLEVFDEIRARVGRDFPVSIKLNSADFQKGGFSEEESLGVVQALAERGMDLIEISGGTYEAPRMAGQGVAESTRLREAYFLAYAEQVRQRVSVPLMVTGGFRSREGMDAALASGATDLVGLARPLVVEPDFGNRLLAGGPVHSAVAPIRTGIRAVDNAAMMEVSWYTLQLARIARGKAPHADASGLASLLKIAGLIGWRRLRMGRLRA